MLEAAKIGDPLEGGTNAKAHSVAEAISTVAKARKCIVARRRVGQYKAGEEIEIEIEIENKEWAWDVE